MKRSLQAFIASSVLLVACLAPVGPAVAASVGSPTGKTAPGQRARRVAVAGTRARPRFRDDRVLVRMQPTAAQPRGASTLPNTAATTGPVPPDVRVVEVAKGTVADAIARLRRDPAVAQVQPDYLYYADAVTPNDTSYAAEWGLATIHASDAWSTTTGDGSAAGPVVAVVDTGVDYRHPDLAANMWTNVGGIAGCPTGTHGYNAVTGSCDPMDGNGHGTHVSGTIGAVGGNGIGVAGVNWHARLMGVKFLDSNGVGSDLDAIRAIDWVVAAKQAGVNVRVINASWGGPDDDPLLDAAIVRAYQAGILFVAAAGNDGVDNDATSQFPCVAAHVVCVAATDLLGDLASFSNFGATTVALAAPGQGIVSTWLGGGYQTEDGTSMATPHVSGAAALVLSAQPGLSVDQLTARILASTDFDPNLANPPEEVSTRGVLDVCKAVPGCSPSVPAVAPTPPLDVAVHRGNGSATVTWSAPASNGGSALTGYTVTAGGGCCAAPAGRSVSIPNLGTANARVNVSIRARNTVGTSAVASAQVVMLGGGYELDAYGGLHAFRIGNGAVPPTTNGGPYWRGLSIARGVALLPSGTGGYVLDGFGGLHPFGIAGNAPPPPAVGGAYWPGWNIARGVAMLADGTGGYVVDGFGGLHSFAVGANHMPATPRPAAYWRGWDVVRGLAIVPSGTATRGGYVLDAFGGLHPFTAGIGGPPPTTGGPYWVGRDLARGVTLTDDGRAGYVGDSWGGLHAFGLGGVAPPVGATFYRAGQDLARGPAL